MSGAASGLPGVSNQILPTGPSGSIPRVLGSLIHHPQAPSFQPCLRRSTQTILEFKEILEADDFDPVIPSVPDVFTHGMFLRRTPDTQPLPSARLNSKPQSKTKKNGRLIQTGPLPCST